MTWLVSWLWQGLVLAVGVSLLLRVWPSMSAATRHTVWWATLVVILALPLHYADWSAGAPPPPEAASLESAPASTLPLVVPAPPDWVRSLAIGVWLGVVAVGFLNLVRAARHLRQLKLCTRPVPAALEHRLTGWMAVRGAGRPVELLLSDEVTMASVLGLGRPMIVLPSALVESLDADDLDRIVLHEYAHVQRHDDWARLVQAIVAVLVGFHPAVRLIGRALNLECEVACDDYAVAVTGAARRYAACLTRTASVALQGGGQASLAGRILAPGVARCARELAARVGRLLDRRRNGTPRPSRAAVAAAALVLAALGASLGRVAPVLAFADAREAAVVRSMIAATAPASPAPRETPVAGRSSDAGSQANASAAVVAQVASRLPVPPPSVPAAGLSPIAAEPETPATEPLAMPSAEGTLAPLDPLPARQVGIGSGLERVGLVSEFDIIRPPSAGEPGRTPWRAVADAGSAVGTGAAKGGVATAAFFTRLGKSIAGAF